MRERLERDGWRLDLSGAVAVLRCSALEDVPGLRHGFSTAEVDAGPADSRDPEVLESRRAFLVAVGLEGAEAILPLQVHGLRILEAGLTGDRPREADAVGLVRHRHPGLAAGVRTADCIPILLADGEGSALAAVHAGWRGAAAGIAGAAVRWLGDRGVPPDRLVAAVGPAALACCYEVGEEVVGAVLAASGGGRAELAAPGPAGRPHLDLHEANRRQLRLAGVPGDRIRLAPCCTVCSPLRFHSHRRDGERAGRLLAVAGFHGKASRCSP